MKSSRLFILLAVTGALVAAGCGSGSQSVPEDAVAVVDGKAVTQEDLDAYLARARLSYKSQKQKFPKAGTPEYQSLQSQIVAFLVQREQYAQVADDLGITIADVAVKKRIDQIVDESFDGDHKRFDEQLKAQGYTSDDFSDDVRVQLISEALYDRATKDVKVSNADVKAYYEQNKAQYEVPESRDVRHILVKTKAAADKVYAQLQDGADFAALATKLSIDPGSKDQGGKLTISRGQTVELFDKTAFELKTNEISKPIKTEFGFHVIQALSDVRPGKSTPFSEVEDTIRSQLLDQRRNDALQAWLADLNESYADKITYGAGFEPPVSSTDTTNDG